MTAPHRVQYYMNLANLTAGQSKDPRRQVGAVLVSPDGRTFSTGYNGFPIGISDTPDRLNDKAIKNDLMVHAELNAILNCPTRPAGWSIYVTRHPCHECAKAIIQAGIKHVRCPEPINPSMEKAKTFQLARDLLQEAEVSVRFVGLER